MTRDQAEREIKSRYAEYLRPARRKGFICPLCNNGSGQDGDGMLIDPKAQNPYTLHCFKCGFHGSIVDLYQQEHNCTTGEAFRALYDVFGLDVEKTTARNAPQSTLTGSASKRTAEPQNAAEGQLERPERKADYTGYLRSCLGHIFDPAAQSYLALRGISQDTATRYALGYDPASKHLIVPVSSSFYIARSVDPEAKQRYMNPAGASAEIFNAAALYKEDGRPVFIVEGTLDALSIIEAGGVAVGLNSTGNIRKFLEDLEVQPTSKPLILCLDADEGGQSATPKLEAGLKALHIPYTVAEILGEYKDPNEALVRNRAAFTAAVTALEKKVHFPGLLTLSRAAQILDAVEDTYLEMQSFPQLSQMVKIRTHDTVVIAADTGAGKSSLALNVLHDLHEKYPALYINLEMDEATVLQRLVAIHTGIDLDEIEGYKHDPNTRERVNAALKEIVAGREIQLLQDVYDLKELEAQIKTATQGRAEPTLVFVDTGLLVTTTNKAASRYERFTQISEELRRISRLNNIILFVLLQQNREGKKEEAKAPTNSSLKESGSWENDATKIMFLWRNPATGDKALVVTKNRSGKTGSIGLSYYPHTQRYAEAKGGFVEYDGASPWDQPTRKI